MQIAQALVAHRVKYAVAGGYAVALHGAVRGTVDLDLVLAPARGNYEAAQSALQSLGLHSRLPLKAQEVFDFREEYLAKRNLVAWSFIDPQDPTHLTDIVLTWNQIKLPIDEVMVGGISVPVLKRNALIAMKRKSGRPQDLADIAALEHLE